MHRKHDELVQKQLDLPCKGQTRDQVRKWFDEVKPQPGDTVVVRTTHAGIWSYTKDTIEDVYKSTNNQIRVALKLHGAFYRNGVNCYEPTGQTRFVELTPDVLAAAESNDTYQCIYRVID
ncbi:MAG: hypothetical protein RIG82_10345 [Phycisphaeraceae bacterium]